MRITECRYMLKEDHGTMRTVARKGNAKLVVFATGNEPRDIIEATVARTESWAEKLDENADAGVRSAAIHLDIRHGM